MRYRICAVLPSLKHMRSMVDIRAGYPYQFAFLRRSSDNSLNISQLTADNERERG